MTPEFLLWLADTQFRRDALTAYAKTGKPSDTEGRAIDSLTAITMSDEAARLLSEAEAHLDHERSKAMLDIKSSHKDKNSRERELMEKDAVRDIQLVVEACRITHKSCVSRYFNYKGR